MDDEETAKKKLKKIADAKDISSTIKKLERKKEVMEDDFKDQAHNLFENLNPITSLDHTLQNVKKSSSSKYNLFKQALAFGAGYLSKRKLVDQLKNAFINTFKRSVSGSIPDLKATTYKPKEVENNRVSPGFVAGEDTARGVPPRLVSPATGDNELTDNKKQYNYMEPQIEKVKAKPEVLPEPTYWPFFLAMGLAFLGWGLLTTWLISLAGFIILIVALNGWINILRHE